MFILDGSFINGVLKVFLWMRLRQLIENLVNRLHPWHSAFQIVRTWRCNCIIYSQNELNNKYIYIHPQNQLLQIHNSTRTSARTWLNFINDAILDGDNFCAKNPRRSWEELSWLSDHLDSTTDGKVPREGIFDDGRTLDHRKIRTKKKTRQIRLHILFFPFSQPPDE